MLGTRWRLGERITIGHDPTVRSAIAPPRSSDGRLRQSRLGGRSWLDSQNKWTTHRGQVTGTFASSYLLSPCSFDAPQARSYHRQQAQASSACLFFSIVRKTPCRPETRYG